MGTGNKHLSEFLLTPKYLLQYKNHIEPKYCNADNSNICPYMVNIPMLENLAQ